MHHPQRLLFQSPFRLRTLLLALCFAAAYGTSSAQVRLDNWRTVSSMLNVRNASVDAQGRIWAATAGGIFVYDPQDSSFRDFRNIDALLSVDITEIQCDTLSGRTYAGSFDGMLEIADRDLGWRHITSIASSNFPRRKINHILVANSNLYIATDFGIAVFDPEKNVFTETISKIAGFQQNTPVKRLLLAGDTLWAATDLGVAKASVSTGLLAKPDNWTFVPLPGAFLKPVDLAYARGSIYAAAGNFIFQNSGNGFSNRFQAGEPILRLSALNDSIYFSTMFVLCNLEQPEQNLVLRPQGEVQGHTSFIRNGVTSHLAFFRNAGLAVIGGGSQESVIPNSPLSNQFTSLAVDRQGSLWVATNSGGGEGFMRLHNGRWENYTAEKYSDLRSNSYYRVSASPDGRVWIGNWGSGLALAKPSDDTLSFQIYDMANSALEPVSGNYVVAGRVATDPKRTSWIVNYKKFVALEEGGRSFSFPLPSEYHDIAIDNYGTKWFASISSSGLYYFNERNTPERADDDITGTVTSSSSNLPDNTQSSIAVDKNGALWIGTPAGLAAIFDPSAVLRGFRPSVRKINILANQIVNAVMVDALNYKWVATKNGVFVINEDGTEVLAAFDQNNSPLLTNDIISLASNEETGDVYFGTRQGMSVASSLSLRPAETFTIRCFPQPFVPQRDAELVIEGLEENSDVRILTLDGQLIQAITTTSRKTVWNGRSNRGDIVPSGVYVVVASSATKNSSSVAKFAVVNK